MGRRICLGLGLALAALVLFLPGLICLSLGGWATCLGVGAVIVWLGLGRWVWQAWRQWRQNNFQDYV